MRKILVYFLYSLIAAAILVAFSLLFPAYNDLKKMKIRVAEIEDELEKRKAESTELRQLLVELENNPKAIEKVAREKYNLCKPTEVIYKYNPEELKDKEGQ